MPPFLGWRWHRPTTLLLLVSCAVQMGKDATASAL